MSKSNSRYDQEYSYFRIDEFIDYLENQPSKYTPGTIRSYKSVLKTCDSHKLPFLEKNQTLLIYIKENCRGDLGRESRMNNLKELSKKIKDITNGKNKAYYDKLIKILDYIRDFFLQKEQIQDKPYEVFIDGWESLISFFNIDINIIKEKNSKTKYDNFVKLVIENCLFFSREVEKERYKDMISIIEENKILPCRKSEKRNEKKGDKKRKFNIQDIERKHKKEFIQTDIDKTNNYTINNIIKGLRFSLNVAGKENSKVIKHYIISHIWGRATDPRFFSSLWNIVLVPSYANDLLDKTSSKEGRKHVGAYLLHTIMAILMKLYDSDNEKNWDDMLMMKPDYISERVINGEYLIKTLNENGQIGEELVIV